MVELRLPYGQGFRSLDLPWANHVGTFLPKGQATNVPEMEIICQALDNPVGTATLEELLEPDRRVVIITSDATRPCPNAVLLPPLLERLHAAGIKDEDITVVIALGLHRPMTDAELARSVGDEVFQRVKVINHDPKDVVVLGKTRRGTPVEIFRPVVEADYRICVGNVEFHYFAGYSGGAKAIVPGVASPNTVTSNHSYMTSAHAQAARLAGNPVRDDLEEAAHMVGADFLLNVIVDENHKVIDASAGDVTKAHRVLCERLRQAGTVSLSQRLDLAIVSAGGDPKDVNLYQAQKALDNCAGVVRRGGVIILLAECKEGYGNATFTEWMTSGRKPSELIDTIGQDFVLGGHKAAAIAKIAINTKILLVTSPRLEHEQLVGIDVYADLEEAIQAGFQLVGEDAAYAVFPYGASTLPHIGDLEGMLLNQNSGLV